MQNVLASVDTTFESVDYTDLFLLRTFTKLLSKITLN